MKYASYTNHLFDNTNELKRIYLTIEDYYTSQSKDLDSVENLEISFFSNYPAMREKEKESFQGIFEKIRSVSPDPALTEKYLLEGQKSYLAQQIALRALDLSDNKVSIGELQSLLDNYSSGQAETESGIVFVSSDLNELLEKQVTTQGLRWRLDCLNKSLGSLRKGDFGFVFKRPETGGTSFLADQITYMVGQTDRQIIWINNEEQGEKVMLRCYEAITGTRLSDILSRPSDTRETYLLAGGDRICIVDTSSSHFREIDNILRKIVNPALLVIDQIDKVSGFANDRKDLEYGSIYRWVRELAKKHCPVIGVCQASATAENKMWLTMDDIAESKTAKAAEADWILGIGKLHDDAKRSLRYFNICKNKLVGDSDTIPELRHGKFTVLFKPEICRYLDIEDFK